MKIVFVDETFHPSYGYQSNPLAKFLQKQGHQVNIVTVSKSQIHPVYRAFGDYGENIEKEDARYTESTGVPIIRVPTKGYFMHRAIYDRSIFKVVRKQQPDIVFVHCVETLTAMRFLLHRKEWPLLFDSHMLSMASESRFVSWYETFYRLFFRRIIEKNRYYVVRTQDDDYVNSHLGISKELTPFISFGTDTILFSPSVEVREQFRKETHIGKDDFVVLYTGKLTEAKGGLLLAETFSKKFNPDVTLVCVGSPPEDEYGKQVITMMNSSENRVLMFPTQSYLDLPKYYQMADLSIFPKQCSMSFYDAQSCGLPVISEKNNVNEQRCGYHNGMNFEPNSVEDMREKVKVFSTMRKDERAEYSKNARAFVEKGYDYDDIAKQYAMYLQRAIRNDKHHSA